MSDYKNKLFNIVDMLKGEINRMCVTDDITELDNMASYAVQNLQKLLEIRYEELDRKGGDKL